MNLGLYPECFFFFILSPWSNYHLYDNRYQFSIVGPDPLFWRSRLLYAVAYWIFLLNVNII